MGRECCREGFWWMCFLCRRCHLEKFRLQSLTGCCWLFRFLSSLDSVKGGRRSRSLDGRSLSWDWIIW